MITSPIITGKTISGRPVYTITVTGVPAAAIERANRASFYGIKKLFGDIRDTVPGARAASESVFAALARSGIAYYAVDILRARSIDTSGTPVPYKAEIDFVIDC